ncbi:hypothetical protein VTH06DRAFT_8180 [Thermothelomyces fergusii]
MDTPTLVDPGMANANARHVGASARPSAAA